MSKRFVRVQLRESHDAYLADESRQVDMVKDVDGRWNVRCYNRHNRYIGGISSVTDILVARRHAETYAVNITQKGE